MARTQSARVERSAPSRTAVLSHSCEALWYSERLCGLSRKIRPSDVSAAGLRQEKLNSTKYLTKIKQLSIF